MTLLNYIIIFAASYFGGRVLYFVINRIIRAHRHRVRQFDTLYRKEQAQKLQQLRESPNHSL